MCAKEFSGMSAVMITQTNGWDDTLVDENGEAVPYYLQGLAYTSESQCDADVGGDPSSEYC